EKFLQKNGLLDITPVDKDGLYTIGQTSSNKMDTLLHSLRVEIGLTKNRTGVNREVIIFNDEKKDNRSGYRIKRRKVSVNREGYGKQQFMRGIDLIVEVRN